ncbi:hypothetical protein [Turicimonas sp. TL08]
MDKKSKTFAPDQAFQILCNALQAGAVTLPFGREVHVKMLEQLKNPNWQISKEQIIKRTIVTDIEPLAKADAAYLVAFYNALLES